MIRFICYRKTKIELLRIKSSSKNKNYEKISHVIATIMLPNFLDLVIGFSKHCNVFHKTKWPLNYLAIIYIINSKNLYLKLLHALKAHVKTLELLIYQCYKSYVLSLPLPPIFHMTAECHKSNLKVVKST